MPSLPSFERDLYFGDIPLETFVRRGGGAEPWQSFQKALSFVADDDRQRARATLEEIAMRADIESRFRLQAWHSLRELGGRPPHRAETDVLGVVVEVGMPDGQDLLAAYADLTAYYYNYSGSAVIWLRPDASLDSRINSVLAAASTIVPVIGPWVGPRRPPPLAGMARLNMLTPLGLHFGEAPLEVLERDASARPLIQSAAELMATLTSLPRGTDSDT